MRKKYYIIYYINDQGVSELFTLLEDKDVADDWCKRNSNYYYIERTCE